MPCRFDVVAFDWYATLGAPQESDWWTSMFAMLDRAGASVPNDALATWMAPPTAHLEHSLDEQTYRDYERRLLEDLLDASGVDESQRRALSDQVLELRDHESVGIYPDVVELLEELRSAGVRVALCSNWSWDLDRHLDRNQISDHFDAIVCSAIVGYRKPHPAIFEALLDQLGTDPGRIAFVGDDWSADIAGAQAAGLYAVHLAREGCAVIDHGEIPCAADLVEVRTLLA